MENKAYFDELSRVLKKHNIESGPVENGRLVILLNGQSVGRIEKGAIRCVAPGEKVNCPTGAREATRGCLQTAEASEAFCMGLKKCNTLELTAGWALIIGLAKSN